MGNDSQIEELTDKQLYAEIQQPLLDKDLEELLLNEFKPRQISISDLDKLALDYEIYAKERKEKGISIGTKIMLILFPFIPYLQAILANAHLKTNNKTAWKEHWKYVLFGWTFYTALLFMLIYLLR